MFKTLIETSFLKDYSVTTEQMSKIHDFSGGMFCHTQLNASASMMPLRLSITI